MIEKRKTARDLLLDQMIEYHKAPNDKRLKELITQANTLSINGEQLLSKAKEIQMKNKAEEIKKNPANLDIKLRNRIENGNKLIADLKTQEDCTPYSDSILMAARFNKMRILEAHISTYSDAGGLRERKINETEPATGRNALHYLSYMANSDMI